MAKTTTTKAPVQVTATQSPLPAAARAPHAGKCPSCQKVMPSVTLQHVVLKVPMGREFHGASYLCPLCQTVLSVGIDPLALKQDTVAAVLQGLGKKPK